MIRVIALIFFVLPGISCFSQQLTPPIQNYSSVNYKAASQNWHITIDQQGLIFAANNQGLLTYDGQQWDLHPLQTGSIIRSVYSHEDRIYTGSYQEFGYWARDNTGELEYTSLMPLLGEHQMQSEEFWEILSYKDGIYFRSFGAIYRYKDDEIKPIRNVVTNKMTVFKDRLLIAAGPSGLFYLEEDGEIEALPNQEILEGKTMIDIAVKGDSLLIGTRDALYVFDGERCKPYPDKDLNNLLASFELNHIMVLDSGELVLGTIKNGIIQYDERTKDYTIYNRNNGLQNNTVLGMAERNGSIWLGLDNGIDRIDFKAPLKVFTDDTGQLGAVYDLAFYNNETYLASNTGVYRFSDEGLEMIEGSEGHTWNLEVLDGKLFVNHNTGTYRVKDRVFEPVEERTGSFQLLSVPGDSGLDFIGTYTGITGATKDGEVYTVNGINFPVKEIIFENRTSLWAAHPYEGIYHIKLDQNLETAVSLKKLKDIDGHGHYNANIFKINNQLAILNNNKWYKYNNFLDSLEVFEELKAYEHHKVLLEDTKGYWFTNTRDNSLRFSNFKDPDVVLSSPKLTSRMVKNHEKIIQHNDSIFYVTLNDGFAQINLKELLRNKDQEIVSRPIVQGFSDVERRYDLTAKPEVPYRNARDINVQTALPVSDASGLLYELIGNDTIEGKVESGVLNFQNLRHGEYQLNLFALSPQRNSSAITSFAFSVNPPWYLSWPMRMLYFLLALVLLGFIYWFNQLKLRKQQLLLEQKFEKEHEERLNQLEKERLMNEITLKRKELANTTMVAAKKNEVLMEIQGELNKDKSKFSNQFRLKHIMNKINKAVRNKDEWQVFETNFNELHEDFFKDLLKTYPQLSNKDLKLCSYLKMNLTSKEIAPLMGISVRGVEVHRYRLRKKMGLDKKDNLTNFLIKNF